jgi:hypothetical protein
MADFYREEALEIIIAQLNGLRAEFNASKQKVLYQLFGSSFAILFWVGSTLLGKSFGPSTLALLLVMPLAVNALMWAFWMLFRVILLRPSFRHFEREEPSMSQGDIHALYMEYEALRFTLHRERRVERIVDLLTAIQFILMAIILAYALVGFY